MKTCPRCRQGQMGLEAIYEFGWRVVVEWVCLQCGNREEYNNGRKSCLTRINVQGAGNQEQFILTSRGRVSVCFARSASSSIPGMPKLKGGRPSTSSRLLAGARSRSLTNRG